MADSFCEEMQKVLKKLNCVSLNDALDRGCQPFYVYNKQVGLIRPDFWLHLKTFTDVFVEVPNDATNHGNHIGLKYGVHLNQNLSTYQEKSDAINNVLSILKSKDVVPALTGWRHENYSVCQKYGETPVLEVERAGAGLFGVIQYGVQVNGYTVDENGRIRHVWIGRRSKTKQTFPDMFDNMVAGGLPAGMGILECVKKECEEEASLSGKLLDDKLHFAGTVSYFYEDDKGMFPECQFVYDLLLPEDFMPENSDGEVGSFLKVSVTELKDLMTGDNITPTCAAICLDFLIRHGLVSPDTDPLCSCCVEQIHVSIQSCYAEQ